VTIAKEYLITRQIEENGLDPEDVQFEDQTIKCLIREYTCEAGVRNLEREIGKICRKIARLKATKKNYNRIVKPEDLEKYMGPPVFFQSEKEKQDEIGVATGMAWTNNGGDITTVEALIYEGKGNLTITGQIGEVMQESAQAALSYIKSKSKEYQIPKDYFEKADVHIHLPEGAVPKDGPSAGITLAIAVLSAMTNFPVKKDVAMTGEITLRGNVLPVGGIKEKMLAAHRVGINTIVLPEKNMKDLSELPQAELKELEIHPVNHMSQVIEIAFGGVKPVMTVTKNEKTPRKKAEKPGNEVK
jgi:ATP-dependent Lon protease